MHRLLVLLPLLLPIVANAAPTQTTGVSPGQVVNAANDLFSLHSDHERRVALHEKVVNAGSSCTNVTAALFAGLDLVGNAYWDVRCRGGDQYRLTLSPQPFAAAEVLACGAHIPGPRGGPCFQTAYAVVLGAVPGTAGGPRPLIGRPELRREAYCTATCSSQLINQVSACTSICLQGGDSSAPPLNADAALRIVEAHEAEVQGFIGNAPEGMADRIATNFGFSPACHGRAGYSACLRQGGGAP